MRIDSKFITQTKYIFLWIYNKLYNYIPLFFFKRILLRKTGVVIPDSSVIHTPVRFFGIGKIEIGEHTTINPGCYLDNRMQIKIGNNVSVAHDTKIYTLGHDIDNPLFIGKGMPVEICDYVCIFSNVLVMPGVKIGKGSVIYPGSVVTKNVGEYEVYAGNPAKFIRFRSQEQTYTIDYKYWFAL